MFVEILLRTMPQEELSERLNQFDSLRLPSLFSENAFKSLLEVVTHYESFE